MAKEHIDLKGLVTRIKSKYSSDKSAFEWFVMNAERLGIHNADSRRKMIDLRGEKTPSTTVTKYLNYCDFGADGRRHDILNLIQDKYQDSFPQAVKRLAEWENEPLDSNSEFKPLVYEEKEEAKPYTQRYLKKMKDESFKYKDIFKELMQGLCRTCSLEEMRLAIKLFEIGLNSYEDDQGNTVYRLFIPEYNYKKIPFGSFRYNRGLTPKGLLRRNARRVLFSSHLMNLFNSDKPIIFTEGHSDCIVNNSKKMASVTSGSSTTKIGEDALLLLSGKIIHFFPDADEAGIKGVCQKIMEIEEFNARQEDQYNRIKYKVFLWGYNFTLSKKETKIPNKKQGDIVSIKDLIKFQINFFKEHEFHAPEEARVKNWKVFPKEHVKEGYDFIDFHNDYAQKEGYKVFKQKYSF